MTDDEQRKIFSKNINKYIEQSGKLQKEIAKELGYSPTTFNTWCVGKIIPSAGKIQKIADYFNIGKSDLLDDKDFSNHTKGIRIPVLGSVSPEESNFIRFPENGKQNIVCSPTARRQVDWGMEQKSKILP